MARFSKFVRVVQRRLLVGEGSEGYVFPLLEPLFMIDTHMTFDERLKLFGLAKSLRVEFVACEVGSYLGASTCFLAAAASLKQGHVHAVDTSREMLALLEEAASGATHLTPVLSQETAIPLEDGLGDILFTSTVYHEFEDRPGMLREMQRLARPRARHVVIDWNGQSGEYGPPLEHRIGEETVVGEYAVLGMELVGRFQPGPNFYGLIFRDGRLAIPSRRQ